MAAKAFFVLCAQAFLLQSVYSQCLGRFQPGSSASPFAASQAPPSIAYDGCGGVSSTGGGFAVTSASPFAPTGVLVVSENAITGALTVDGNLPLLGSVGVEGAFSNAGAGAVSYGCGNGGATMFSEGPIITGILAPGAVAPAPALSGSRFFSTLGRSALAAPSAPSANCGIAPGLRRGCGAL